MTTQKAKTPKISVSTVTQQDVVEAHFCDAFERLQRGKPTNAKLAAASKAGKLRITVTTVALEAGHSRTLIGHKSCKYPAVRDRIQALKQDPENPTRMQDIVTARRQDVARLKRELQLSQTQNATLVVRALKLQQELERLQRTAERGRRAQQGVVVPLRS